MPPCLDQEREVRLHGKRAGTIRRLSLHELAFAYAPGYREDPTAPPLSTCLPKSMSTASTRRATAWFTGLLPEGPRRDQLARIVGTTSIDLWTLLDAAGAECAGAVQIVNPAYEDVPSLLRLDARELEALLHTTPVEPIGTVDRSARISLAGAQDKVALARSADGAWAVPLAGAASTHILKPQSTKYRGLVENEHWCMTIARSAGLEAARTEIITVGERAVLVVERYDREATPGGGSVRVHQEDTAQTLATTRKYESEGGPTLGKIARVRGISTNDLIDRITFNWIVGNADGHAKNLSVLEPGTRHARLAPAYDVLCTETYADVPVELAITLGGAKQPGDVTALSIAKAAQAIGADPHATLERVARLAARVAEAAHSEKFEPYGLRITVRDQVRSRATRASRWADAGMGTTRSTAAPKRAEAAKRERSTQSTQERARSRVQAPTKAEVEAAERYLLGRADRPALDTVADEIATERLDGSARVQPDPFSREWDVCRRLLPHTRERPREENQWKLDRENLGPVRSNDAARTAARMLVQVLDQYQREQYGETNEGTPREPPPAERFFALTAKGRERKREKQIAKTIEHWRSAVAPNLLRQIRQAIIPLEVQFRRNLAEQRKANERAAEEQRRQVSAQLTPAPPRPHGRDRD